MNSDTDVMQCSLNATECRGCILLNPFPVVHEMTNGWVMNSLALCRLHPFENVILLCSCSKEFSYPDNCFASSLRFEVTYKYFFDMFSGILPQNSEVVTISLLEAVQQVH